MYFGSSTKALFVALLLCVAPLSLHATTWMSTEVRDPITSKRVKVDTPASSGSYIYAWPEKSDQVFWPHTDPHWLWFNPKSGYIAFGNDFEDLDPARRAKLQAWLEAHFDRDAPPRSRVELLAWAERVYEARGMDEEFWRHFFRLMAYETRADAKVSLGYVAKALPLLEKKLAASSDPEKTLETLYLLSEYNRRLGRDVDAKGYLDTLAAFEVNDQLAEFKQYLLEIAAEQQASGGKPAQQEKIGG